MAMGAERGEAELAPLVRELVERGSRAAASGAGAPAMGVSSKVAMLPEESLEKFGKLAAPVAKAVARERPPLAQQCRR